MDAVLACTLDEIAAVGVEGLSVDRIARAADVNKTSVYRRWPTRGALVAAAFERVLVDVEVQLEDTGTLRGDLLAAAELIAATMSSRAGRALARAAFADSLPEVATLAVRLARRTQGPVHDLVRRARARGEWRASSTAAPADVVMSALTGAIVQRVLFERRRATRAWLRQLVDVLARGCGVAT